MSFHVALSFFFHPVYFRVVWRAKERGRFKDLLTGTTLEEQNVEKFLGVPALLVGVLCSSADLFP